MSKNINNECYVNVVMLNHQQDREAITPKV